MTTMTYEEYERREREVEEYLRILAETNVEHARIYFDMEEDEEEHEVQEDYFDDGDDRGDCVSTVREQERKSVNDECVRGEDNVHIVVHKQLVDGMLQEFVGVFPNHYEAFSYLESQGVYEHFWTDQFGRQWEIVFDEQVLPKWCEERESFTYGI